MKKPVFTLSLILFFNIAFAQENKFRLLVVAGFNASQINGDNLSGFNKFGINTGLGIQRKFSRKSGLQLEFIYSEKGSKDVVTALNPINDTLFQLNYIDLPLVYTYSIYSKFNVELGIYNSVRVKAIYSDYVNNYDKTNIIRRTDHGGLIGLNYQLFEHLSVNGRLSQSFFDINASIERYFNFYTSLGIRYSL